MVRLINKNNVIVFKKLVSGYMQIQKYYTHIHEINNNYMKPCIYAMWHSDQFCIYGIQDKGHLSVLISNSADGDIVDYAVRGLGFKTVRGSSGRGGAIEGTLKMVELLEQGESVAIMVDGPNGPLHKVKNGVIRIAKHSGAPIIPVCWYCPQINFVNLPSWDKMTAPIGKCNIINLYGEPIYVPKDTPQDKEVEYRNKLKTALEELQSRLPEEYKKAKSNKVWSK
jgi:lysophospholipid acyltransferase (LPLAT)-like uncharacterized protein